MLKGLLIKIPIVITLVICLQLGFLKVSNSFLLDQAVVTKIVDGDTIKVSMNFEEKTVRLIGVDTPESVHPDSDKNTKLGVAASQFTKSQVSIGQTVYLQKDRSDTDQYGRLLRYVWIKKPKNTKSSYQIKTRMLNSILVSEGYAKAKAFPPDTRYKNYFSIYEKKAKQNKIGLWNMK